jgi:Type II intron maturase
MRGILEYYSAVDNKNQLSYIIWILTFSACFTLARKLNISPRKVFQKYGNPITITFVRKRRDDTIFERKISLLKPKTLSKNRTMKPGSSLSYDPFKVKYFTVRSNHLWDRECLLCGSYEGVKMHHVRHIHKGKLSGFTKLMSNINRKQIPVCFNCHRLIHSGRYDGKSLRKPS